MFKHIAFTYLSQKTDTSLENRAGMWFLSRGCLLLFQRAQPLVGDTQATQQPNSTTQQKCLSAQYHFCTLDTERSFQRLQQISEKGYYKT